MEEGFLKNEYSLVMIGGSAGSLEVILQLMPCLRNNMKASIAIILHRKNDDSLLAKILDAKTSLTVIEAEDKTSIEPGRIYVAPADYHLLIEKDKSFSLDFSEKIHYSRPSIDVSFETAADALGGKVAAFLLSGANADGAKGLLTIKQAGGFCVAQDTVEASVDYMPSSAIRIGAVNKIMKLEEMMSWFSALQ